MGFGVCLGLEQRAVDQPRRLLRRRKISADVGARAKSLVAGSRDDNASAIVRCSKPLPSFGQLAHRGARQGVALRLIVDRYQSDMAGGFLHVQRH